MARPRRCRICCARSPLTSCCSPTPTARRHRRRRRSQPLRGLLQTTVRRVQDADGTEDFESLGLLAALRNLKIGSSQGAVEIVRDALEICGIAGYKRDTPFSLDHQLRDVHGGLVMVSNDRYLYATADALVMRKQL